MTTPTSAIRCGNGPWRRVTTWKTSPSSPASSRARRLCSAGLYRSMCPTPATRPRDSNASTSRRARLDGRAPAASRSARATPAVGELQADLLVQRRSGRPPRRSRGRARAARRRSRQHRRAVRRAVRVAGRVDDADQLDAVQAGAARGRGCGPSRRGRSSPARSARRAHCASPPRALTASTMRSSSSRVSAGMHRQRQRPRRRPARSPAGPTGRPAVRGQVRPQPVDRRRVVDARCRRPRSVERRLRRRPGRRGTRTVYWW